MKNYWIYRSELTHEMWAGVHGEFAELGGKFVGRGGEFCGIGWRVCDSSSRWITEVKHTCPQPVTGLVFTGSIPVLHTNLWFQKHLIKQLWPPDGCRRTERRLSTTLAEIGCVLSTQQEINFNWIDPSEWWWREKWWTSKESL